MHRDRPCAMMVQPPLTPSVIAVGAPRPPGVVLMGLTDVATKHSQAGQPACEFPPPPAREAIVSGVATRSMPSAPPWPVPCPQPRQSPCQLPRPHQPASHHPCCIHGHAGTLALPWASPSPLPTLISMALPSMALPSIALPSVHGPTLHDPYLHGPNYHGSTLPSLALPSRGLPSMHGPRLHGPTLHDP